MLFGCVRGKCILSNVVGVCQCIQDLPTKLAEWIGENMQDKLGFPDKADTLAAAGTGWTPAELNHILNAHLVDGALTTLTSFIIMIIIKAPLPLDVWNGSQICSGARCVPDAIPLI